MTFAKPTQEVETTRSLDCDAHGCPCRWSIQSESGRMCRYHAFAQPESWPAITEILCRNGPWLLWSKPKARINPYHPDRLGWAKALRDRAEAGEKLNPTIEEAYKSALRLSGAEIRA